MRSLVKRVATHFAGVSMCISRTIPKLYLIEIFELDYFSKGLHKKGIGHSKRSFGSNVYIGDGENVVPQDQL